MSNFLKTCAVHWVLIVILVAGFCAGLGLILYTTAIAPWVYSDLTAYLLSARNMADGMGLVLQTPAGTYEPLIWYPPLFSTIISILISFGAEMVQAARWINAGIFGAFISLGAYITWYFSRSKILSMGFIILVLLSPGLLQVYSGAISEPIFIFNTLAALFLCVVASNKINGNKYWLWREFLLDWHFYHGISGLLL